MSLKPPGAIGPTPAGNGTMSVDAFAHEAMAETAAALGHIGRKLEEALEDLRRHDANPGSNHDREELLQNAAERAWVMFIQRDFLGLRSDHHLFAAYDIPREVLNRVGVRRRSRGA
jgi:hypothetical protein